MASRSLNVLKIDSPMYQNQELKSIDYGQNNCLSALIDIKEKAIFNMLTIGSPSMTLPFLSS